MIMITCFTKPHAVGCDCQEIQQLSYSIVGGRRHCPTFRARSLPHDEFPHCHFGKHAVVAVAVTPPSFARSFEQPPLRICSRLPSTAEYVMSAAPPPSSSSVKVIPAAERIALHGPRRHARLRNSFLRQATILCLNKTRPIWRAFRD